MPNVKSTVQARSGRFAITVEDQYGDCAVSGNCARFTDGRTTVRHASPSLFGATDYALELHLRTRGSDIEVLRVRGDARESVLRFSRDRPPEGAAAAKSLLELFGYPVTRWRGRG